MNARQLMVCQICGGEIGPGEPSVAYSTEPEPLGRAHRFKPACSYYAEHPDERVDAQQFRRIL